MLVHPHMNGDGRKIAVPACIRAESQHHRRTMFASHLSGMSVYSVAIASVSAAFVVLLYSWRGIKTGKAKAMSWSIYWIALIVFLIEYCASWPLTLSSIRPSYAVA